MRDDISPTRNRIIFIIFSCLAAIAVGLPAAAQSFGGATGTSSESAPAAQTDAAVEQLLSILKDDQARADLISRLEAETEAPAADDAPQSNVAENLAESVIGIVQQSASAVKAAIGELARIDRIYETIWVVLERDRELLTWLGVTILVTLVVAAAFRPVLSRMSVRLKPPLRASMRDHIRAAFIYASSRIAALALIIAAGLAVVFAVAPQDGAVVGVSVQYLLALGLFGGLCTMLRVFAAPDADREPVLSDLAPPAQAIVYRNIRMMLATAIFGFALSDVFIGGRFDVSATRPLITALATVVLAVTLFAIWRVSKALNAARGGGTGVDELESDTIADGIRRLGAKVWPPLAMLFAFYCWFVVTLRPALGIERLGSVAGYTAFAVVLLLIALRLTRVASRLRLPLPDAALAGAPRLRDRFDGIATSLGWILAATLAIVAMGVLLHGWGIIDVAAKLDDPAMQTLLWRFASVLLVLLAAALLWAVVSSWIDQRLKKELGADHRQARTLLALFRSVFTIAVGIIALMIALSQLGIDIAPLIAGAGIIGLAIGFGSQKLVEDMITGVFLQFENAVYEGDVITVAGLTGTVEKLTIRSVRIRALDGAVHVVPFSSVDTVTNLTRGFAYHVAEIGVAYKEKIPAVKSAMQEAFDRLSAEDLGDEIIDPLEMHGVTELGDSAVVVRARIKTTPANQWAVGRRYNELVKDVMDERGIEIPFPHRQLVLPDALVRAFEGGRRENEKGSDSEAA